MSRAIWVIVQRTPQSIPHKRRVNDPSFIRVNINVDEYSGYSKAELASGIVSASIGSFILGALMSWCVKRGYTYSQTI